MKPPRRRAQFRWHHSHHALAVPLHTLELVQAPAYFYGYSEAINTVVNTVVNLVILVNP